MCTGLTEENPLTIREFTYSIARLNRDQYFKGYTFLVFKQHATELYQLKKREREGFMTEMVRVADALAQVFKPDKMNYELLGNKMPHLHWHLIPRYKSEPFWGDPVWSNEHFERRLSFKEYQKLIIQLQEKLARSEWVQTTHSCGETSVRRCM